MKMSIVYKGKDADVIIVCRMSLGHVNNIPTMQFSLEFPAVTHSKSGKILKSLTMCVREFQNDALWDAH